MGACVSSQQNFDSMSIESLEVYTAAPLCTVVSVRTPPVKHRNPKAEVPQKAFHLLSLSPQALRVVLGLMDKETICVLSQISKKMQVIIKKWAKINKQFDAIVLDD